MKWKNNVTMKPFKLGDKSWRKAQVTARLDKRSYTVETDDGAVYHRNRQHLRKTSQPPVEPIITAPQPDMASADEKATTTAASTPNQSNAPLEPRPFFSKGMMLQYARNYMHYQCSTRLRSSYIFQSHNAVC